MVGFSFVLNDRHCVNLLHTQHHHNVKEFVLNFSIFNIFSKKTIAFFLVVFEGMHAI